MKIFALLGVDGDGELIAFKGAFSSLENATEYADKLIKEIIEYRKKVMKGNLPYICGVTVSRKSQVYDEKSQLVESELSYDIGYWFYYPISKEQYFHTEFIAEIVELDNPQEIL